MEEALESAQGAPLLTLFKAVCKKWLLIGFLAVLGGLLGCVYAFAALPLTKDVYEAGFYLSPSNTGTDKSISYYNDQNIANIKSYLGSTGYKNNVFSRIKDEIFTDIEDIEKREAEFKKAVKVSVSVHITIYVMNQERDVARTIFNAFVGKAEEFVNNMMDGMSGGQGNPDATRIAVIVSGDIIKTDPKEISVQGYVGTGDRITAVIAGVLLGAVAGAAAAVCIYYFNNRLNSLQMLVSMGFAQVYVDKKHKNGVSIYDENAVRYKFVVEKQGCKVITFISPAGTEETAMAFKKQAESMRKNGYRVSEIAQNGQTHEQWKEILASAASGNDFVLVNAAPAHSFDCAVPGALSDGVAVIIDQKIVKMKQVRHTKEIIETAKLNVLAVFVVNTGEDFVQ